MTNNQIYSNLDNYIIRVLKALWILGLISY